MHELRQGDILWISGYVQSAAIFMILKKEIQLKTSDPERHSRSYLMTGFVHYVELQRRHLKN